MSLAPSTRLRADLHAVSEVARSFEFRLPGEVATTRRADVATLVELVDDYLLSRLADLDGPALAVVIGSTGSGKSTIVNSLAQASITRPGAVRPTTRRPVAWTHESNAGTSALVHESIDLVRSMDDFVRELTIVDAPDFDSVVAEHREIVEDLIRRADFAVYVTTAQRYADGVPWDVLRGVVERGIPLLPVINRLPAEAGVSIEDFARLLRNEGVSSEQPVAIEEQPVDALHGGLPIEAVSMIRERLELVGADARKVVRDSTRGAVHLVLRTGRSVSEAAQEEQAEIERLAAVVDRAYEEQVSEFQSQLRDGSMIRNEVVQRWNEQLGAGQLFAELGQGLGRLRGWLRRVFGGAAPAVQAEAQSEVTEELLRRAGVAARQIATAWDVDPGARQLLDESSWVSHPSTEAVARSELEKWLDSLTRLVQERGEGRKRVAQAASYGVNAVAVMAMIVVFSQTAGMTGAEVGITAGAAAVQQKLLEYVLGSAAARSLVTDARNELIEAVRTVFAADADRFDPRRLQSGYPVALDQALDRVEEAAEDFYA